MGHLVLPRHLLDHPQDMRNSTPSARPNILQNGVLQALVKGQYVIELQEMVEELQAELEETQAHRDALQSEVFTYDPMANPHVL